MIGYILLIIIAAVVIWVVLTPLHTSHLVSHPKPATNYEDALARVEAILEAEDQAGSINPVCEIKLLTHGSQTENAITFLHGFSNCPEQFAELGERFYEKGFNVLIMRAPYHGLLDRMTTELTHLTAEDLAAYGDTSVDITAGLGRNVFVSGISAGGTVAIWLAQNRKDVTLAAPIAAFNGLSFIPSFGTRFFTKVIFRLPNFFMWWDPRDKDKSPFSVSYAYPRYPFRVLGEILRLALVCKEQSGQSAPSAHKVIMITNAAEPAVNNSEIQKVMEGWQKNHASGVSEYQFEKELKLPHDMITPGTPGLSWEEINERLVKVISEEGDHV